MATSYGPVTGIVTDGLIRYYDAYNEKSYGPTGASWKDICGTTFTATKAGTQSPTYPQFNQNGYYTFIGGEVANNYSRFDVSVPGLSAMSLFVWYRPLKGSSAGSNNQHLFRMSSDSFNITINTSEIGHACGLNYATLSAYWFGAAAGGFTFGKWNCSCMTFNGNTLEAYYNGYRVATGYTANTLSVAAGTLRIGTRDDAYAAHYFGDISCIAIYNRSLTAREVEKNFNALRGRFGL